MAFNKAFAALNIASHFDIKGLNLDHLNMAKTVSVVVTDDLDGSSDAQTVTFGFDGQSYEIDLGKKNLTKLQKSLQPFVDAGRRTAQRRTARAARGAGSRVDRAAVRTWAAEQGLQVSERGRISSEVMSKYEAAH
ncbi:MAG TPA: Lsr2 family protein [Streptosporangiaceae bacterium]|jgi:hypothetical protein